MDLQTDRQNCHMKHMAALPVFFQLFPDSLKTHLFPQNLPKGLQQFIIFLRTHDAEPDIGGVQEGEGGAVPDHQAFSDTVVKDHIGGHVFPEDPDQEKVGAGGVDLYGLPGGKSVVHPLAFSCYESFGLVDIIFIREHDTAGDFCKTVDGPGIFLSVDILQQIRISCYRITQPQAGSSEKFGDPAKNNEIVVIVSERDGGNLASLRGKFFVGFVHHYRNAILEGAVQDFPHIFSGNCCGSRIVGIAQHQQI